MWVAAKYGSEDSDESESLICGGSFFGEEIFKQQSLEGLRNWNGDQR